MRRFADTRLYRFNESPNRPYAASPKNLSAHSPISAIASPPKLREVSRRTKAPSDPPSRPQPPSPFRPDVDRSRSSFRPSLPRNSQITEMHGRQGYHRPSGETAIGIPIAYPAISHQTGLAAAPEAPLLLRVVRQSNSGHRRRPVTRAGGIARRPDQFGERC